MTCVRMRPDAAQALCPASLALLQVPAKGAGAARTPWRPRRKTKLLGSPFLAGSLASGTCVRFFLCSRQGREAQRNAVTKQAAAAMQEEGRDRRGRHTRGFAMVAYL